MRYNPRERRRLNPLWLKLAAILFWIAVWEIGARALNQEILLVSPFRVCAILFEFAREGELWWAIASSFGRIALGFMLALGVGTALAGLAHISRLVKELLSPLMVCVKSMPVASFVILALVWIKSQYLSIFISFLMALPIFYSQVGLGLAGVDPKLLEMADVFGVSKLKRLRYIYIPGVRPLFMSACRLACGLCWKAGVAAEVIGLPAGSIGEKLYEAKIFLSTGDMFAWTLVIVLVSLACERIMGKERKK